MSVTMRIIVEFLLLVIFLTCVFCKETDLKVKSNLTELTETGRRHHGYGLYKWWGGIPGLYALGVLYWLKVKAVIVAFIVGTAIVWGFKWYKGGHCGHDIIHESPIISYDHGPAWSSGPHDHIPYSLGHNPFEHDHGHSLHEHEHFTSSDIVSDSLPDNGPYSSYAGAYSDVPPTAPTSDGTVHARHKRQLDTEQQVSDIVFAFLGITNDGCRRRFICEMEFRSKANPFTRIAFGIVGRGLFSKYVNRRNVNGRAGSFRQCADVNPDCVLMEENIHDDEENEVSNQEGEYESRSLKSSSISDIEKENSTNLKAEKESFKQNLKTDPIVQGIFSRMQPTY
ncbi:uncharacterized protein LOC129910761 [Episyrphus balteatus]|uniref:uncharacterized protein LOC129910761 n=1 Tax=Episyrphus balteatus TaxID=286459 RepID=UPI0024863BC4|nr:uncharacterized protein LOC129910761 [Episyrphus balteatus]